MEYRFEEKFLRKLAKLKKADKGLYYKILEKIQMFGDDERHPSLRCHKLTGKLLGYWSISMDMGIRIVYFIESGVAYFVDIGTHDEVYRMN